MGPAHPRRGPKRYQSKRRALSHQSGNRESAPRYTRASGVRGIRPQAPIGTSTQPLFEIRTHAASQPTGSRTGTWSRLDEALSGTTLALSVPSDTVDAERSAGHAPVRPARRAISGHSASATGRQTSAHRRPHRTTATPYAHSPEYARGTPEDDDINGLAINGLVQRRQRLQEPSLYRKHARRFLPRCSAIEPGREGARRSDQARRRLQPSRPRPFSTSRSAPRRALPRCGKSSPGALTAVTPTSSHRWEARMSRSKTPPSESGHRARIAHSRWPSVALTTLGSLDSAVVSPANHHSFPPLWV